MIVSWNWLKEYVRLDMPVETLVERLMLAGLNHEQTSEVDGDFAIDLEVTSNRPDCLGHIGIARETAVVFGSGLKLPPTDFAESSTPVEKLTNVIVESDSAGWCPQYRARVIEGVKIGPSPDWLQRRLRSVGLNPINNVVDITNYVLLECGQPLHAFDFDKLREKRIVVRHARAGELISALNNKQYELAPPMGVIADADRPVALAGVMGGADTEVGDRTTTILLESAEFAPLAIRRTSRALDLSSDSSYRFERKIDPAGVAWASDRACHLICKLAGGKPAKGYIHIGVSVGVPPSGGLQDRLKPELQPGRHAIRLRWARLDRILGIVYLREQVAAILRKLGCQIEATNDAGLEVVPPTFRRDLTREIDLIEEVGRIAGYQAVPENRVIPLAIATIDRTDRVTAGVRDTLCATGYFESITFSFVAADSVASVRPWAEADPLVVRHSSRKQENCLRQSLIPSLLASLRTNEARGNENVALFEIARIYLPSSAGLPNEQPVVGLVSQRDIREVRGHVELLFERLGLAPTFAPSNSPPCQGGAGGGQGHELSFAPATVPGFAADRVGEYLHNGKRIGVLGYIADQVRDRLDLRRGAVAAELLLMPLVDNARLIARVTPLPDQPAIVRDLAIVLDEQVRWSQLEAVVRQSAGVELESLEFVDLYRGKQVPDGKKSIAFRLTYRAADRTLTRDEVDACQQRVLATITDQLGGILRT